ncbi:MAG: hypothetical protein ACTSPQ_09965, partial [Candidatus Helarchaeota archaeon]
MEKIIDNKYNTDRFTSHKFKENNILAPIIKKFQKKDINELKEDIIRIRERFKLLCFDFLDIKENDIEYLRNLVLILQILNGILERSLNLENFDFSWKEIISNL